MGTNACRFARWAGLVGLARVVPARARRGVRRIVGVEVRMFTVLARVGLGLRILQGTGGT